MTMVDDAEPEGEGEGEGEGRESHRERTIRMRAIAALGRTLLRMNASQLATIPLAPELAEAIAACRSFRKGARARQLRLIGSKLRQSELEPIERAVAEVASGRGERSRREQGYELWRTRLLEGGDPAMTAFVAAHPGAEVQSLRQQVRAAVRDPEGVRGKGAARELLRSIRAAGEAVRIAGAQAEDADAEGDEDADEDADADGDADAEGDADAGDDADDEAEPTG